MRTIGVILLLNVLKLCSFEHIWHHYQYDPIHQSREELVITSLTSDESFKFDYVVRKWKSLCVDKKCYLVGLMEQKLMVASIELNSTKNGFVQDIYLLELEQNPVDVALIQNWNTSTLAHDVFFVVASQNSDTLLWYKIFEKSHFWTWSLSKNISHVNVFQIDHKHHILLTTDHHGQASADLYEFSIKEHNFWLRQKIGLADPALSSGVVDFGPNYYLALPQTSLNLLMVYKLSRNHFLPHKNLSSINVDQVISFKVGHKAFVAFNGFNAGIYRIEKNGLVRENITDSHLDGVNFWLSIPVDLYGDHTILMAQRSLHMGVHRTFVIEVITYNGDKFEEHEDMSCLYFGETLLGLSCLPDQDTETGIEGSTSVLLGDVLAVVVPRKKRLSDVFFVQSDVRKIDNPVLKQIEEFVSRKQYIDDLIKTEEKKYEKYVASPRQIVDFNQIRTELDEIEQELDSVKEFLDDSKPKHYDTVIFENAVDVVSAANFGEVETQQINHTDADALLQDIVLKNNISPISSTKTFTNLKVEDLFVEKVNGINASDLLFITDELTIENLRLEQPLSVSNNLTAKEVNGLIFQDEVIASKSSADELVFESVHVVKGVSASKINAIEMGIDPHGSSYDKLSLPLNLEVVNVNGENFKEFLSQLCLINLNHSIPGLTKIEGEVAIQDGATEFLNDLKFPSEYVFSSNSFANITGLKNFAKLTVSELTAEGEVDGILTADIITLSTNQNISNTTTFKNLKITEGLYVEGKIVGEHASKFLPNPTLLDTNFVKAKVQFKDLEVDGVVVLSQTYNGQKFEALLSDVVYTNEKKAVIQGMKQFPEGLTVRKNLFVQSNSINNISLDSIVTKDTDQFLNLSQIRGVVNFGNVETELLYDNVSVKQMDEELVKLNGEQYVSSVLIFESGVSVDKLQVTQSLNTSSVEDLNDEITAENVIVEGNISGEIQGFDLKSFDANRLSLTKDQSIQAEYIIDGSTINHISAIKINDLDPFDLTSKSKQDKLQKKLKSGSLEVESLYARSIELEEFDNKPVINLEGNIWANIKRHDLTNLVFYDNVYFDSIEIDKLSGVSFERYLKNLVFKNETDIKISGIKTFAKGLTVNKLIETNKLNHVLLDNILRKYGHQKLLGPVTIHGDVSFANVSISETINELWFQMITESFQVFDDYFQIKGDMLFNRLAHIYNLEIQGYCMDRSVPEVVDSIVYQNLNSRLRGLISFDNNVNVEKNMRVLGQINGVDLPAYVSDMVLTTKDIKIEAEIQFKEPVAIQDVLTISNDLITENLNGFDLQDIVKDAIFVNKGLLRGHYIFEDATIVDNLNTRFVNDIDTETLIPLRSEQNLSELSFNQVSLFKDVDVGSVNSHNLSWEFDSSVFINHEQVIDSEVEFIGNVLVEGDVQVDGLINDMETDRIVTTNSDQNLEAIYRFKAKTNLNADLQVEGLVNGIDITEWTNRAVLISSPNPQFIGDKWTIQQDLVFEDDARGNGLINGLDLWQFSQDIVDKRNYKYLIEKGFIDDYKNMCKDLNFMYKRIRKQIYKFNYLEDLQVLRFQNNIEYVYEYNSHGTLYLIIHERKNCDSYIFLFDSHFRFVRFVDFGLIAQIISVKDKDSIYLVVRNQPSYSLCKVQGTSIWKIGTNGFDLIRLIKMDDQDLLQESLIPHTFYGLSGHTVTEFKILPDLEQVQKYRKWTLDNERLAFVPNGFATGLAMRTGQKLIKLNRDDNLVDFSNDFDSVILGNYTLEYNSVLPGPKNNDLVVMGVGVKSSRRKLLAVATHEETSVEGSLDFIKIYDDIFTGKLFHRVPTYKPSSLTSLEFNNGETLLAFLEDASVLQVYEYKGIEGFKHKLSVKIQGSKLLHMSLNKRTLLGVVNRNQITFVESMMLGDQVEDNLHCNL